MKKLKYDVMKGETFAQMTGAPKRIEDDLKGKWVVFKHREFNVPLIVAVTSTKKEALRKLLTLKH